MKREIDEELDWNRNTVKMLGELTAHEFCEVIRGAKSTLVRKISDGEIIPAKNISFIPKEGTFFTLSAATCGNPDCKIGEPDKKCSGYTKGKCGVYYLDALTHRRYSIDSEKLCELLANMETIEIAKEVLDRVCEVAKKPPKKSRL